MHRSKLSTGSLPFTPAASGIAKVLESGAEVESVSLQCWRLVERLEPGHAVRLRVDGELLKGVYSTGGARQKREELLPSDEETHGVVGGSRSDSSDGAAGSPSSPPYLREISGGGPGGGGDGDVARTKTVEVVPWEAAGRLLLACPFNTKLPVLRYSPPYVWSVVA